MSKKVERFAFPQTDNQLASGLPYVPLTLRLSKS